MIPLYKEKPSKVRSSAKAEEKTEDGQSGIEYSELIKKPYFYAVIAAVFLHMLASVGAITTPHFTDIGLSPSFVANTVSIMAIALAAFKLLSGVIYD